MRAMILAAGLGTRLAPLTTLLPKPLVPVAGIPNIVRLLRHLRTSGVCDVVINTHHLAEVLESTLGNGSAFGVSIVYSREDDLLGTGGGIKRALPLLGDETFVVLNGDALFLPDLGAMVETHRRAEVIATLVVRQDDDAERHGAVGVDNTGRVRYLLGSGERTSESRSYMFTGAHVLEPAIGAYLPDSGCIVRRTYQPLVEARAALCGHVHGGAFFDLGTVQRYLAANLAVVTGRATIPGYSPSDLQTYVGQRVSLGPGCHLGLGTVLCDDSAVADGVKLERCVVLPGATATHDLCDAVLMASGAVLR